MGAILHFIALALVAIVAIGAGLSALANHLYRAADNDGGVAE